MYYLPLKDGVVTLLKKGFVPLSAPEETSLPGYRSLKPGGVQVTDEQYLRHMRNSYAQLPAQLAGLLTFEAFLQQAQQKRKDIERAISAAAEQAQKLDAGQPQDWLWLTMYSDADSALAWSVAGFDSVWLAIDEQRWPEADVQPIQYTEHWPASFPQRLLFDSPQRAALMQGRVILPRESVPTSVEVAGQRHWLLRIPPHAIRRILIGSGVSNRLRTELGAMLRQDFRYQRIPVATMQAADIGMRWQFQTGLLTSSEKA